MKSKLEKRFTYLYTGELTAVIMFIGLSYLWNRTFPDYHLYTLFSFWASFLLFLFILVQGTIYWYSKRKQLQTSNSVEAPVPVLNSLRICKRLNVALIVFIPIMFIFDMSKSGYESPVSGVFVALFFYTFAIVEHINYYHVQLSYDNREDLSYLLRHKKLKRSILNKELMKL